MMRRRTFLKLAAASACVSFLPTVPWSRQLHAQATPESLDDVLEPIRAVHRVPALAAAFVRSRELIALGAVGTRRINTSDRVQPQDRWHLGSCTKSMTATLVALLIEQGKLSWQTTIADITPPGLLGRIHQSYHRVTVLQFLSHRSGLPDDRGRGFGDLYTWARGLTGPLPQQRRVVLERILSGPPGSDPGSRYAYANFGYTIAGTFVEHVTGQAWEDLIRQMLFQPLGMSSAGFGPPGAAQPWGHQHSGTCQPVAPGGGFDVPPAMNPAGAVHCSIPDWARYAALHLQGAPLLKPESFQRLHTDEFRQGYALGWGVQDAEWAGGTALRHSGSNGMWFARIWVAPKRDVALLAATNCGGELASLACDAATEAMIRRYLP